MDLNFLMGMGLTRVKLLGTASELYCILINPSERLILVVGIDDEEETFPQMAHPVERIIMQR